MGSGDGWTTTNARNICLMFSYRMCGQAAECSGNPLTPSQNAECETRKAAEIKCDQVKAVRSTYDRCLSDLLFAKCPFTTPPSCEGLFRY